MVMELGKGVEEGEGEWGMWRRERRPGREELASWRAGERDAPERAGGASLVSDCSAPFAGESASVSRGGSLRRSL